MNNTQNRHPEGRVTTLSVWLKPRQCIRGMQITKGDATITPVTKGSHKLSQANRATEQGSDALGELCRNPLGGIVTWRGINYPVPLQKTGKTSLGKNRQTKKKQQPDLEDFLFDGLKGENLSKKAKEKREAFIKRIKEVKSGYPQEFNENRDAEDSEEDEVEDSNNDGGSLHSERTDKEDETCEGAQQSLAVAAQDLQSVFKAGYLEKRRKDHSFFGTEWQKRWCALSNHTFYYYGSEKDKQQKGEFAIDGYSVKMNNTLRKDSKKDCCFEISSSDKRVYQFCASSQKEAEEWVEQIDFVLRDMSGVIPLDEEDQETYDDIGAVEAAPIDDDIYEELPEEDMSAPPLPTPPKPKVEPPTPHSKPTPPTTAAVNKITDYQNYYQGIWDCTGDQPDELSFRRGDAIYILSKEYQNYGWWIGEMKGSVGIVPKEYLMELYAI